MAVWNRTTENAGVHSIRQSNFLLRSPANFIGKCDDKLGLEGLTGMAGWALPFEDYFKRSDVVHLHLIHNGPYFSILSLPILNRLKPLVWTIHDSWATTGGCLYSFDCDRWLSGCAPRCPYPRRKSPFQHYIPAFHWQVKKRVYQNSDLTLVVASQWMQERVQRSPLLHEFPCHLIPFGIDLETFRPRPKVESRKKLGIWPEQKVIVFRDHGFISDRFKGLRWLMEALQMYEPKEPTCLLVLEDGRAFRSLWPKYSVITPGWIDGEELAIALSAADVFLMPSINESFGLMAVESMACGTPVIVCEGTALPDVIKAPKGGMVIPARDSVALARAIQLLLEDHELNKSLGMQARQVAESEYSLLKYVQCHIKVYEEVIDHHR
jgi:glycosyltransferase involved in cell wall biosynthesis